MVAATSHGSAARPNASPSEQPVEQLGRADLLQELVPRDARRDRVDPHAVLDGFDCAATGQRHHAGLGRGVVRLRMLRTPAEHAGVVDDHAAVAGVAEVPQRRAGRPHHRRQRHVEDPVPLLVGHVDDRGLPPRPALLTRTSSRPIRSAVEAISASTCAVDVTSQTTLSTRPRPKFGQLVPGLAEPAFVVVGDDDVGTLGSARRAVAEPMPVPAAAVTTTTLPVSRPWPSISFGRDAPTMAPLALHLSG